MRSEMPTHEDVAAVVAHAKLLRGRVLANLVAQAWLSVIEAFRIPHAYRHL
ncbi:MAG: hypothetical protein AAFV19_04985 [Pseudomonadota bacterium]